MRWLGPLLLVAGALSANSASSEQPTWVDVPGNDLLAIQDDDIRRHAGDADFFAGLKIEQSYFVENGFRWHLLRFTRPDKPDGPLWMVPHDNENAAFDAAVTALKEHGGVAVVVNSGPGSAREQVGDGVCGVRAARVKTCDPNRNFSAATPLFTAAFLDQPPTGQPIIALHTNSRGFSGDGQGGRGQITILDAAAYRRGMIAPRAGGYLAVGPMPDMANYDTLGLIAYLTSGKTPDTAAVDCRKAITKAGVHFWHEHVSTSDGSMSNYRALNRPDIAYFNAESREEVDLAIAAARHKIMIDAYLAGCMKPKN
jgi:hypothetical protein